MRSFVPPGGWRRKVSKKKVIWPFMNFFKRQKNPHLCRLYLHVIYIYVLRRGRSLASIFRRFQLSFWHHIRSSRTLTHGNTHTHTQRLSVCVSRGRLVILAGIPVPTGRDSSTICDPDWEQGGGRGQGANCPGANQNRPPHLGPVDAPGSR